VASQRLNREIRRKLDRLGQLVEAARQGDTHCASDADARPGIGIDLERYMGASLTMIDRHYVHLARDGREHAIRLLDELSAGQRPRVDPSGRCVDVEVCGRRQQRRRKHQLRRRNLEALWRARSADPSLPFRRSVDLPLIAAGCNHGSIEVPSCVV
jgi:hypothetical protein